MVSATVAGGGARLGQPEVHDLRQIVVGHHHVGGLEVAMHDAVAVRGGHAGGHLASDGRRWG